MNHIRFSPTLPAVVFLALLGLAAPAGAIPATLENTGDTYVATQAPDQSTNYGGRDHIYLDPSGSHLGLVRFDNLPDNIETLNSATLNLYKRTTSLDANPTYIDVHMMTDLVQWIEGADDGLTPPDRRRGHLAPCKSPHSLELRTLQLRTLRSSAGSHCRRQYPRRYQRGSGMA